MSADRSARPVLMERFRSVLPLTAATPMLTLGEGATPLVRAPRLGASIGASDLWLKVEGANPTGSFKDRGMVVAVAKVVLNTHTLMRNEAQIYRTGQSRVCYSLIRFSL